MISDDDLLLYLLDDGLSVTERTTISMQINNDAVLRARLECLRNAWPQLLPDPVQTATTVLPAAAAARLHARLDSVARQPALPAKPHADRPRNAWQLGAMVMASVVATTIGVAVFRDLPVSRETPGGSSGAAALVTAQAGAPTSAQAQAARFERSLKWYLVEVNQQLATLRDLSPQERVAVIDRVLAQNRLYISAAERADEARSARNLRALAPVIEMLRGESGDASEFENGLAQIGFEVKVIQTRLSLSAPPAERQHTRMLAM